jgi:hypothetical protein
MRLIGCAPAATSDQQRDIAIIANNEGATAATTATETACAIGSFAADDDLEAFTAYDRDSAFDVRAFAADAAAFSSAFCAPCFYGERACAGWYSK